jgi:hypothetical protein
LNFATLDAYGGGAETPICLDMDQNQTAIERAFALAKSGVCASIGDIRRKLRAEGYTVSQIEGPTLARQLRGVIVSRREQAEADRA